MVGIDEMTQEQVQYWFDLFGSLGYIVGFYCLLLKRLYQCYLLLYLSLSM